MQLDSLIIETRVRSAWSSIDLGFALARRFWLRSVWLYIAILLPAFLLTRFLPAEWVYLPYLILWWCKPLFERPILHLLSRELFAEPMPFFKVLGQWRLWLIPGLFKILTIRRLNIYRGMVAPITLLEQPDNRSYRLRTKVLGSTFSTQALWLNVLLFHLESFLYLGFLALVQLMVANYFDAQIWDWASHEYYRHLFEFLWYSIVAMVAPFYVAAGFMLYISRRVELEGWDIEITFRNWMTNHHEPSHRVNSSTSISNDAPNGGVSS